MVDRTPSSRRQFPERELERAGEVHKTPSKVIGKRDLTKTSSDDGRTEGERVAMEAAGLAFTLEGREKLQEIIDSRQAEIQNSPRKSFEKFVKEVKKLDLSEYEDIEELKYALYDLYTIDEQQPGFTSSMKRSMHSRLLKRINLPQDVIKSRGEQFLYFYTDAERIERYKKRISINPYPDYTAGVMGYLVQNLSELSFVSTLKVSHDTYEAIVRKDPILMFFYDPPGSGNRKTLEELLVNSIPEDMLREGYPEMMLKFGKGMAVADNTRGITFTQSRMWPIAEVLWEERNNETTDEEEFLRKVEERYREHGIDPENPEWNLHPEWNVRRED